MIDLSRIPCQEVAGTIGDPPIPIECRRTSPGSRIVFHQNDGRNVYVMCDQCADHNIRRRGGVELVEVAV